MTSEKLELLGKIASLVANQDSSFIELGALLRHVQEEDPELFQHVLKIQGLGRRKAYYLIKIDRAFEPLDLDVSTLSAIGWTKLGSIAQHVCQENVHALISLAATHTDHQLKALMKGKKPVKNPRVVLLYFTQRQYAIVANALISHGAKQSGKGLINQEKALLQLIGKKS